MNMLLFSLVSICLICTMISAIGRRPTKQDMLACRKVYRENLANITGLYDPRATLQAYYVRDGFPCSTYCRIKSRDSRAGPQTLSPIVSPEYTICASKMHCNNNGTCVID